MKQIVFSTSFRKAYRERIVLHPHLVKLFRKKFKIFKSKDQVELYIHALGGRMTGQSAFFLDYDLRLVFKETKNSYIFIDIGTHPQVYQ
ncbi:hypothetical protein A2773_06050 [Candidatus Gottesmanbacteria bacterium RIFCSPHIGHO2_01_FULL_39_10]|uniref:Plasmid stabilization protein n=1 Tax=Candidatus Gottesmanbacteria bacterium RIFCSPHIGHO2_01_FULL_39_10 TaxID=1798375 RepID=A0A1F5ZMQ8_9BACT|nr:MAG: hypothetical protein A2773_06050 [Candidatus Gottesmanbacteria bacterium RIFCSPHIGHO2_01_FULL_39_10]